MIKTDYPKKLKDNDKLCYLIHDFPLLERFDVECLFHTEYSNDMHYHDFYEINIVCRGKGLHYFGSQRFHIKTGDYFVIPTHVKHGYINIEHLDVLHLILTPKFINDNCTLFLNNNEYYSLFKLDPSLKIYYSLDLQPSVGSDDLEELERYASNIIKQQRSIAPESNTVIASNTVAFLFLLFRRYREFVSVAATENVYKSTMQNVMQYISSHYGEKIDVSYLADISGYSRSNFFKFFKKMTDMTPNDFINMYRVNMARKMLSERTESIVDIALACGFYDESHFLRIFKRFTGTTPGKSRSPQFKLN